ncbi:MAG: DUF945 family protein [Desulfobacteraceae bacterium]|jgi:uncharacterized protein YdgA (DUF945 family)
MKKIIVVVALILVIGASIPFASGLIMERTVRSAFQDMNTYFAANGADLSLEIISYDRSYLTSDIEWKVDLGALKAIYRIDEVVFKDHAKHGLTGVVSTTSLEKNPWYTAFVDEKLQGRDPIHISTAYGLFGNIDTKIVSDAFSFIVENETIDVKSGSMALATDRKLKHFTSTCSWQGLSAGEKFDIGDMSMASNLEMVSTFIWDGDASFSVQNIKAQEKENQFGIKGIKGKYLFDVADDQTTMSWEALFSMESLDAKDINVDDASVRFVTKGLNVKGYEEFMKLYAQNVSELFGQMEALQNDPETAKEIMDRQMAAMGFNMMAIYEKLLKAGLELQVADLAIKLPQGDITGGLTLRLLKDMTFMQFAPIVTQPELLFDIVYLKSDFSLPAGLVGDNTKLQEPVFPGMKTGLFVKNGDNLVHAAETADGKLMVNGEEVVLTQ